jgi:hypothetical protein
VRNALRVRGALGALDAVTELSASTVCIIRDGRQKKPSVQALREVDADYAQKLLLVRQTFSKLMPDRRLPIRLRYPLRWQSFYSAIPRRPIEPANDPRPLPDFYTRMLVQQLGRRDHCVHIINAFVVIGACNLSRWLKKINSIV